MIRLITTAVLIALVGNVALAASSPSVSVRSSPSVSSSAKSSSSTTIKAAPVTRSTPAPTTQVGIDPTNLLLGYMLATTLNHHPVASGAGGHVDGKFHSNIILDQATVLKDNELKKLHDLSMQINKTTGYQVLVVTKSDLDGRTIEDVSLEIGRSMRVGEAAKNNGVVVLLAMKERKIRIETGYGAEGPIPDAIAKEITDKSTSYFKQGQYYDGLALILNEIQSRLDQEGETVATTTEPATASEKKNESSFNIFGILIVIIIAGLGILLFSTLFEAIMDDGSKERAQLLAEERRKQLEKEIEDRKADWVNRQEKARKEADKAYKRRKKLQEKKKAILAAMTPEARAERDRKESERLRKSNERYKKSAAKREAEMLEQERLEEERRRNDRRSSIGSFAAGVALGSLSSSSRRDDSDYRSSSSSDSSSWSSDSGGDFGGGGSSSDW